MWAFGVHKATSLLKVPVFWQLRVVRACLALGGDRRMAAERLGLMRVVAATLWHQARCLGSQRGCGIIAATHIKTHKTRHIFLRPTNTLRFRLAPTGPLI